MALDQAELQRLIEACVRDRMRARPYPAEPRLIRRCLGLEPPPPRTDLKARRLDSSSGERWVRTQTSFESQPGESLVALCYTPPTAGPHPLIVAAADAWAAGRREPCLQALGIAMATHGFATVIVEPPGCADRAAMGDRFDVTLAAGLPALGTYTWDLVRAIDMAVAELGAQGERVGLVGIGAGGDAALLAAAMEERFVAVAVGGAGHSQEGGLDGGFMHLPGIAELGDWANVLVHRVPLPLLFLAAADDAPSRIDETVKKLRTAYRGKETHLRADAFLGPRDLNRRMRETVAAFMAEHLLGESHRPYLTEPIPLTDGVTFPAVANTEDPALLAAPSPSTSLTALSEDALMRPYPEVEPDLVPWGKYGRLEPLPEVEVLRLVDHGPSPNVIALPPIDPSSLIPLGLSVPDFYAQMLHLLLPGGPEGWEPLALQGDALTAMIASVRTLMKKAEPKVEPNRVEAEGPVSSLTAHLLRRMRPHLEVAATHSFDSWASVVESGILVPGARYRSWPTSVGPTRDDPDEEGIPPDPDERPQELVEAIRWTADDELPEQPDASTALVEPAAAEAPSPADGKAES